LEVGLDGLVLFVKLGQVRDDVLDDVGVGQRVDFAFCLGVGWDTAQACKSVDTVDIHSAASADTLSATPSECEGGVDLVLDSDQGIQHHRTGLVQIQGIALHSWLRRWLVWVPSVDVECFDLGLWVRSGLFDGGSLRWWHSSSRNSACDGRHSPLLRSKDWSCGREEARGSA